MACSRVSHCTSMEYRPVLLRGCMAGVKLVMVVHPPSRLAAAKSGKRLFIVCMTRSVAQGSAGVKLDLFSFVSAGRMLKNINAIHAFPLGPVARAMRPSCLSAPDVRRRDFCPSHDHRDGRAAQSGGGRCESATLSERGRPGQSA